MPAFSHDTLFARLPYLLELFAVAVAAISGVLAGRGKQVDLFGVLVLALVTSFGGGTLRDLMLGDLPVAWIRDPNYILTASIAALLTFFLARFFEFPSLILLIADAFALALFSASGARKALGFGVAPVIAVAMGVITGVVGGMVRDVLTGEIPLVLRAGIYLYATASMLGASVLVLLTRTSTLSSQTCMLAGIFVTLVLRLASIRWRLVLPAYLPRPPVEKNAAHPPPSDTPD
jgi:uncharacterized membrane protein YeiH